MPTSDRAGLLRSGPSVSLAVLLAAGSLADTATAQDPRFALDTLRVTVGSRGLASLPGAARSVEVLDRESIRRVPARSVTDVLAWALGVDVRARSAAQVDVSVRGGSFEQIVVLIDGVPVSDDQTGHFDLDLTVPLEAVERIEVLRGAGSALYGPDAVGGTINIVTSGGAARGSARIETGSFASRALEADAAVPLGRMRLRTTGGLSRSDGHRAGTDDRTRLVRVGAELPVGGGVLHAHAGYASRDFGANGFYGPWDSYEETRTVTAALRWQPSGLRRFTVAPRVSFRRHDDDYVLLRTDPGVYRNVHENRRLGGELVARWIATDALRLVAGATGDAMNLESTRLGHVDETRAALFGELVLGDPRTATVATSVRADWHSAYGWFASPSFAAALRVSERMQLRASADRGFRAPTWTERFYNDPANIGDPDLLPERFWSGEVGVVVQPAAHAVVDIAAFVRRADRLLDWVVADDAPDGTPWQIRNIERATYRGLELRATVTNLLRADWTVRAATLSFTDEEAAGLRSKGALRPLTETASVDAAFDLAMGLTLTARLSHARRTAEHAHRTSDARASWTTGAWTVYIDALNWTDAERVDVTGLPAPGRAFRLGLRAQH